MNILLTSAGRRTYMVDYFRSALGGEGSVYASNSVLTYTLLQADGYVLTPPIYDHDYISFVIDYCKDKNISVVISLFDIDLPVLAKNREWFVQNGIRLLVSDSQVVELCNDKWRTYSFLNKIGLKQACSFVSLHEAKEALRHGEIEFPLVLKPRWGMGSIGIYQVDSINELDVLYEKLRKDIFKTYLKYESQEDKEACVIIQSKIEGGEYGLDVFNDLQGNYVTTVAKQKIAMRSGETDIAQIVDNAPFESLGRLLSKELRHIANLDVDCFVTSQGEIYVLELNCRFGGQYPFSHNAGVDFPKQIVKWLNEEKTDSRLITPKLGVVSCKEIVPVILYYGK